MKDVERPFPGPIPRRRKKERRLRSRLVRPLLYLLALSVATLLFNTGWLQRQFNKLLPPSATLSPGVLKHRRKVLERCKAIRTPAGPPRGYRPESRIASAYGPRKGKKGSGSDRYVPGTPPTFIKNAKIWTGERNGTYTIYGDILLDKGMVVAVGHVPASLVEGFIPEGSEERKKMLVVDAGGKWVTPGLVDLHSHIGVFSAPPLRGSADTNSHKAPILPWLRSIDGLNTHDESYRLAIAGGVTTAQILPGSANNIGGQAFLIKLRPTAEGSASSKLLEPPGTLHYPNSSLPSYVHWRHMKHACGENPNEVYRQTRMDAAWNFRNAYNEARKIRDAQDEFCKHAEAGEWGMIEQDSLGHEKRGGKLPVFPEDLQWESLVDVLRGKVKVSVHCYEAVDLDMMVRLSNEFQFPVASFHHAGETYLVPDLLKKTWGGTPTIALFATYSRMKREAYRGSEFAPQILAEHDIPVVMKSDHPVLNSRYLLFEAQQAHYHGLSAALALSSVTTIPARAAGIGHRVGMIARGYDADVAIWDSHPLSIGATPVQVFIDGISQLDGLRVVRKPKKLQQTPAIPDWKCEAKQAVKWEGLPPLQGHRHVLRRREAIRFERVKSAWMMDGNKGIVDVLDNDQAEEEDKVVIVRDGKIDCIGHGRGSCENTDTTEANEELVIDLNGGSLAPALTTFGSPLGLVEISLERSTNDGKVFDPLTDGNVPNIIGNGTVIRAVDGLQFTGRDTLLAYRNGVTTAISAPTGEGFMLGLSTAFDTGSSGSFERGAVIQEETAVHVAINPSMSVSVSTQIATLRRLLFEDVGGKTWTRVRKGDIPLVVHVNSADIMATLIKMKTDLKDVTGSVLRLTFVGAAEAHLITDKIAGAGVSVVVTMPRPYPDTWDKSRFLPGPPLSEDNLVTTLLSMGVNVAIGTVDAFAVRNTRFEAAWTTYNSNGKITPREGLELVTTNVEQALGLERSWHDVRDIVAYWGGGVFEMESKVAGIVSVRRGVVETFGC